MKNILKVFLFVNLIFLASCSDYLEVDYPIDQLTTETTFGSKSTINAAVLGLYSQYGFLSNLIFYRNTWLMSDEAVYPSVPATTLGDMNIANIDPNNSWINSWATWYTIIYRANILLEGLPSVGPDILTEAEKNAFIAEAKAMRALSYYFMVNGWGEVPLVLSSELEGNINIPRTSINEVYAQIEKDLLEAKEGLGTTVLAQSNRIHNQYQIDGILARVYLYQKKWTLAEQAATNVINSGKYQLLPVLNDVFKRNSKEAMFSISETNASTLFVNRCFFGWILLPGTAASANTLTYFGSSLLENFDPNDQRIAEGNWLISLYNKKYPNKYLYASNVSATTIAANPQDFVFQRFAEMYLIRAEAKAQLNKLDDAKADLLVIRQRAGLAGVDANTQAEVVTAVENERTFELFYEGHRWWDVIRWGKADQIFGNLAHKKDNWKSHHIYWPISPRELDLNPALVQNPGYN